MREYQVGETYSTVIQFTVEWGRLCTNGKEELAGAKRFGIYGYVANQAFLDFGQNSGSWDEYRNWEWRGGVTPDIWWYFAGGYPENTQVFPFPPEWSEEPLTVHKFVRVTRNTPNSYSTLIKRTMSLVKVTEYSPIYQTYPLISAVHTLIDAKAFSNIPERAYLTRLKTMFVPSNYYPIRTATIRRGGENIVREADSRRYNIKDSNEVPDMNDERRKIYKGEWDYKSLKKEWTDNPVWIVMDILTSRRYGLGSYVKLEDIDMLSFYKVAQYCDGVDEEGILIGFPDGNGGIEPRYSFSAVMRDRMRSLDCITNILTMIDGYFYWDNGKICLGHKQESRKIRAIFTNRTVTDGIFNYSTTQRDERFNVIEVGYLNRHDMFKNSQEFCINEEDLKDNGVIKQTLSVWGCTSKGLAKRLGDKVLTESKEVLSTVSFTCGLEALMLQLNDIFLVDDDLVTLNENFGRLLGIRDADPTDEDGNLEFVIDRPMDYDFTVIDGIMSFTLYKKSPKANFIMGEETPNNILTLSSTNFWIEDEKKTVISVPKKDIGEYDGSGKVRMKTFSHRDGNSLLGANSWYASFSLNSLVSGTSIPKIKRIEMFCTTYTTNVNVIYQNYYHRVSLQLNLKTSSGWKSYFVNEADSNGDYRCPGNLNATPPQKSTFTINEEIGSDVTDFGILMRRPTNTSDGGSSIGINYFIIYFDVNGVEVAHTVALGVTGQDVSTATISEPATTVKTTYKSTVTEANTTDLNFFNSGVASGKFALFYQVGNVVSGKYLVVDAIRFNLQTFEDSTTQISVPIRLYNMEFEYLAPTGGQSYACLMMEGRDEILSISPIQNNKSCNFGGVKIVDGINYVVRPYSYGTGTGSGFYVYPQDKTDTWNNPPQNSIWGKRAFDGKNIQIYCLTTANVWGQRYSDYTGGFAQEIYGFYPGTSISVKTRNNLTRMYRLSSIKDNGDNTFAVTGRYFSQESYEALSEVEIAHMKALSRDFKIPLLTSEPALMATGESGTISEEEYDKMMGILPPPVITSVQSVYSGGQATVTIKWNSVEFASQYKVVAKNVYNQEVASSIVDANTLQTTLVLTDGTFSIFAWTLNTDGLESRNPSSSAVYVYDPQTAAKSPDITNIEVTNQ